MIQQIRDSLDGLYLYPSEKVKIHINPAGGYLVNEGWNKYSEWTLVHISPLERDILLASDGGHRIEDVVNTIGYPLNEAYPEIECLIWKGILETSSIKKEAFQHKSGSRSYFFPLHAMLEITDACNLMCSHCYRSANSKGTYMDVGRIKPIVEQLSKNGCSIIEVTGGEPMLHPQFFDILSFLDQEVSIKKVSILTNGTLLNKADTLREYLSSKKFIVSTTIDSSSPNFHDEIRKVPGSWKRTVEFLKKISKDSSIRVAMNVFPENVNDIENVLLLAKENGATSFAVSPITPTGRGASIDVERYVRTMREYSKTMKEMFRKWKGFVNIVPPKAMEAVVLGQNCGAGHRSWAIDPNGNVRPCVMMSDGLMNMGNVFEEPLEKICSNPLIHSLFKMPSPGSLVECFSCDYSNFCPFCIYKAVCVGCDTNRTGGEVGCPILGELKRYVHEEVIGAHTCYTNRVFLP